MMVNCPRCGFSQPQDQYCARCGIDMLAFKPAQKPFLQRLVGNTVFQITVLVLIVVTVFTVARQHRRRELAERVAEIENARNSQILGSHSSSKSELSSTDSHFPSNSSAPPPLPPSQAAAGAPPAAAPVGRPPASDNSAGAPAGFVAPGTNEDKPASGTSKAPRPAGNVFVTFAALPRAAVTDLVGAADPGSGTLQGPFLSGVVQGLNTRIKAYQSSSQLESLDSSSHSIKPAQASEFYGGSRDETTGQFLGFMVEVIPTQLDENETHLQVRVWRSLRDANGQPEEVSVPLPESFTVPHGAGVFVTGSSLLPRRTLNDQERRLYDPMKVLHVMATEEFRQSLTDLVIFIEPK